MRATRAIIDLGNYRHNLRVIKERLQQADRPRGRPVPGMCVAVKADAYGHGATALARVALEEGAEHLGVATVDEAVRLREAGITAPILLYSLPLPEEVEEVCRTGISPFVADEEYCDRIAAAAERVGTTARIHLKIDTGMGRIGCRPDEAVSLAGRISSNPNLELAGIATHFPIADAADRSFTEHQIDVFGRTVKDIREAGVTEGIVHAANSGAVIAYPAAYFDMVRPGIATYGYYPSHDQERILDLRPVMQFESRIVFIKTVEPGTSVSYGRTYRASRRTVIGTVPAGYADGFNRLLSNQAEVLVFEGEGASVRRAAVAGRVCMDQFMIDLGPESRARKYDKVVLFGPDPRGPSGEEIADLTGTIPYEVTCAVGARVPRVYRDE
ncbi:MAG: alanine racemase [Spirochaetaceae bacterium]